MQLPPDNFHKPVSFLFLTSLILPPPRFYPPVRSIMHVFTFKVIVSDLYDRPLTLCVLVHQHQAKNTQGHVRVEPNLVLCHLLAITSNQKASLQITFIPATSGEYVTEGEKEYRYQGKKKKYTCLSGNSFYHILTNLVNAKHGNSDFYQTQIN